MLRPDSFSLIEDREVIDADAGTYGPPAWFVLRNGVNATGPFSSLEEAEKALAERRASVEQETEAWRAQLDGHLKEDKNGRLDRQENQQEISSQNLLNSGGH